MPAEPRICPICTVPIPATARRRYCSPACKTTAWRREHPDRPAGPPRNTRTAPAPQPAAVRDCPHCGEQITIVALLTTPQIARPQPATDTPNLIPLHPIRAL